ncbi:tRNA 2'-phosphotransferase, partial [Coemansia sp. RSA 788]
MSSQTPASGNNRSRHGRNRPDDSPDVKLSKLLSYLLRHGAVKEGLTIRDDGSIALDELKKHKQLKSVSFDRIKQIVDTNDKKRYMLFQEGSGTEAP